MKVTFTVNGRSRTVEVEPNTPLLYVLRNDLQLHATKFGCGMAQCGACTVILDGKPTLSCVTRISLAKGKNVVTLEGLGAPKSPHPLQQAFVEEQAAQCGYCTSGMIMRAKALLDENADPTEEEVRRALSGNLCRCGTHLEIVRAVRRAAQNGKLP